MPYLSYRARVTLTALLFGVVAATAGVAQTLADTRIAFTGAPNGNNDILIMDPNGTGIVNLTNDPADDSWATWSPEGTQIAFRSDRSGNWDIWRIDVDTDTGVASNPVNLTNSAAGDHQPAWSPSGAQIAFISDADGNGDVVVMDASGANPTTWSDTSSTDDQAPVWSPDGLAVAFIRITASNYDLWTMGTAGAGAAPILADYARDWYPSWSPNGLEIAFSSNRDPGTGLADDEDVWAVAPGGSGLRSVTDVVGTDVAEASWSPDGTTLVFRHGVGIAAELATIGSDGVGMSVITSTAYTVGEPSWSQFLTPIAVTVSPDPVDLGSVAVGASSSAALTISSTGTGPLTVSAIASDNAVFTVAPDTLTLPFTLASGASETVAVTFTPTVEGAQTANITVSHDAAGGSTVVTATGTGASAATGAATITVADAQGQLGGTTTVAIDITDVTGLDVAAVELILTYDGAIITPLNDGTNTTAAAATALVPADWSLEQNVPAPGELRIALAGPSASPIAGGGTMVQATFDVLPTATIGATSPLTLTTASLNEGVVTSTSVAGVFTVTEFMIGDVTGNGTVSPYDATWVLDCVATELLGGTSVFPIETVAPPWSPVPLSSVDAREVADADGDGVITANDASVILQFVVGLATDLPAVVVPAPSADADAVSGALAVSAESMRPRGTMTVSLDASRVNDLRSGELVLDFDAALLRPVDVALRTEAKGTRPLMARRDRDGRVAIAFASARPIEGSGALVEVTFETSRQVSEPTRGEIRASHLRLNGSRIETRFAYSFAIRPFQNRLMANYPNPFNPETWIPFELKEDADVTIRVYGLDGRAIRTLNLGGLTTGEYVGREDAAYWDGKNAQGESVASGVYVYELTAGEYHAMRRMVIMK